MCEGRLGCRYGRFVGSKGRVDARSIAGKREQVGGGDIKWEEKYARQW